MFNILKSPVLLLRILRNLSSIDKSLASLAESQQLLLKLHLIQAQILLSDLKEAKEELSEAEAPILLNQTESQLAEVNAAFAKFHAQMGREPREDESLETIIKVAEKDPS